MTKFKHKVWIEIETYDEDGDEYTKDPQPECLGTFATESEAEDLKNRIIDAWMPE